MRAYINRAFYCMETTVAVEQVISALRAYLILSYL